VCHVVANASLRDRSEITLVPWTDADEQRLWELVRSKGRAWTHIAAAMAPFSDNQIKKCVRGGGRRAVLRTWS
jgi:hypothetical protein